MNKLEQLATIKTSELIDPVLFMCGGKTSRQYTDVMIRDWPAAIHFVEERS